MRLFDVAGKVLAHVIQTLQAIADSILPVCGFQKGRGCIDLIFVTKQLVEKYHEHNNVLFVLFAELRKAYDSVPRATPWSMLKQYGVPPTMLFTSGHFTVVVAEVIIGDTTTEEILLHNGLRQGCTLAPSILASTLVHWWPTGEQDARRLVQS